MDSATLCYSRSTMAFANLFSKLIKRIKRKPKYDPELYKETEEERAQREEQTRQFMLAVAAKMRKIRERDQQMP